MNYYVRYFDKENVCNTPQQIKEFVSAIPGIELTRDLSDGIQQFCDDVTTYPRHFRLPNKTTFIIIKTNSATLSEFKTRGANGGNPAPQPTMSERKDAATPKDEIIPGIYEARMAFRRAFIMPETNKCYYAEDEIIVSMPAQSKRHCYDTLLAYLRGRKDIDPRSQYPGIRSSNFQATLVQKA